MSTSDSRYLVGVGTLWDNFSGQAKIRSALVNWSICGYNIN